MPVTNPGASGNAPQDSAGVKLNANVNSGTLYLPDGGSGAATAGTTRTIAATDDPAVVATGAQGDAAVTNSGSSGSLIAFVKGVVSLIGSRLPSALVGGRLDVNIGATGVTQPVSGTVAVSNLPATQPVSGTVAVSNFPATQPVSAASLPLPAGAATSANQSTGNTSLTAIQASVAGPTPAGENHLGEVGGKTATPSGSVTRPADTNAYAAGDAITNSTGSPSAMTIANAARVSAGSGVILGGVLTTSANQPTKPQIEAWIFTASPTPDNDNAAFTPTDTETNTLVAVLPFTSWYVGDATTGAGGNAVSFTDPVNRGFKLSSGTSLFALLVVRNAYTPVSGEVFTLTLPIIQD